ncbi:hypothetical protein WKI13_00705 [Teredinibacter turnerae]|uniref:hypothetical protein n=1 Tax=Teredinibacter turnerae TaxID=2426 RepID=UPI00036B33D3|nr:hypothetical protein [Teredinibacter turnerae]
MKYLVFLIVSLYTTISYANTICSGKVYAVTLNPDNGTVKLNYGYGHNVHCNVDTEYNGVSPASCKVLFSQLLVAQMADKSIEARYNDDFICSKENLGDHVQTKHLLYQVQIIN